MGQLILLFVVQYQHFNTSCYRKSNELRQGTSRDFQKTKDSINDVYVYSLSVYVLHTLFVTPCSSFVSSQQARYAIVILSAL